MSAIDPTDLPEHAPATHPPMLTRVRNLIAAADPWLRVLCLGWITPLWRLITEDDPRTQLGELWRQAIVPMLSIAAFLTLWSVMAPLVQTS